MSGGLFFLRRREQRRRRAGRDQRAAAAAKGAFARALWLARARLRQSLWIRPLRSLLGAHARARKGPQRGGSAQKAALFLRINLPFSSSPEGRPAPPSCFLLRGWDWSGSAVLRRARTVAVWVRWGERLAKRESARRFSPKRRRLLGEAFVLGVCVLCERKRGACVVVCVCACVRRKKRTRLLAVVDTRRASKQAYERAPSSMPLSRHSLATTTALPSSPPFFSPSRVPSRPPFNTRARRAFLLPPPLRENARTRFPSPVRGEDIRRAERRRLAGAPGGERSRDSRESGAPPTAARGTGAGGGAIVGVRVSERASERKRQSARGAIDDNNYTRRLFKEEKPVTARTIISFQASFWRVRVRAALAFPRPPPPTFLPCSPRVGE